MFDVNIKIISELKSFLSFTILSKELLMHFSLSDRAFSRTRKLPFDKTVLLIAKLCKKTLSFEISFFLKKLEVQFLVLLVLLVNNELS